MSNFVFQDENESFRPRLISSDSSSQRREIAASVLPKGAHLLPKTAGGFFSGNMPMGVNPVGGGGGGSAAYHMQRPYFPGTESPDRVQYPKSRAEANKAWRLFNESDPILGTAIDMYSEMLVSDFDLVVGDEKSREIRDTLEYMCQVAKLQETLRYIIKEFLVMGEAFPHNFFDDKLGIWTYTAFHDPDNVDVLDSPMINADPILSLTPDEELRQLMVDNSPEARELRSRLPQEFVSKILARQRIRLSPLNCTFIPRKLHPYQTRGTSLVSRMWRIFMVEDAVYNSTIATFRRHSAPLKVVKLGNAATGWMPGPGAETKVLEMLNRAETDPHCFLPWMRITLADGSVKQIQDLSVGEKLLDRNGKVCEVLVLQQETTESYRRFWVEGERWSIDCTPTHKFDVWNGTSIVKLPASEIQEGQYFRIPRYFEEVTPTFPCDRKLILEQCFENKPGGDLASCRAEKLKLTEKAMHWPLTYKRVILDYLFSEEFNGSSGFEFGLTTCSFDLYWQVKLIQAQLGERSFCDVEHLVGKVHFNIQHPDPVRKPDFFVTDEYVFARIFSIETENQAETVFNMTVSGDHSYCVQHYGTHNSWLVYNYGIEFEAFGTTDKAISISREHEVIERVKLLALGLSKSFMTGEVTYASGPDTTRVRMANESYSTLGQIQVGDLVKDRFGMSQKVTDVLKYPAPDQLVEIVAYGKRTLRLTHNHFLPVFTRPRTCLCGCGTLLGEERYTAQGRRYWRSFVPGHHKLSERGGRDRVWVEYKHDDKVIARFPANHEPVQKMMAAEVIKGDWLMIPRTFEVSDIPATEVNLQKARLLGYFMAEGCMYTEKDSLFTFGYDNREKYYVEDSCTIIGNLGFEFSQTTRANGCLNLRIASSSRELSSWLDENSHRYSHLKHFSSEVMHWNLDLKKELIKGMLRGDGYLYRKGNRLDIVYVTTSEQLMMQTELILAQLGYASSVHRADPRVDKKKYEHKECWYISIFGQQAQSLAKLIWADVPDEQDLLDFDDKSDGQGDRFQVFKDDNYLYLPVESVRIVDVDKSVDPTVISLTVENTESYTLENLASFNSAKSGLQVFLRRLLSLRQFLENIWLYPKFFRPISEINEWTTSSPSEINHKYRLKRTAQEIQEQNLVLMPTIKWKNKLDPSVDQDLLNAFQMLEKMGVKLSKATISSAVGVDWQDELDLSLKEFTTAEKMKSDVLGQAGLDKYNKAQGQGQAQPPSPPGAPGSGAKPTGAGGAPPGGAKPPSGGMNDASKPPGSGSEPGGGLDAIQSPSGGGLPTGVE